MLKIRYWMHQKPQTWVCLLIFLTCVLVYLSNGRIGSSNDNIPHTLLAFNWLENHTLHFDVFRGGYLYRTNATPYFLTEAPNGHLTSSYPIGTALVSFPLYVIFFLYLKALGLIQTLISGVPTNLLIITDSDFNSYRIGCERIAGAVTAGLTVVLFYLSVRLKFSPFVSHLSTFVYAFAMSTWVISSQGLRQHTISNLIVTGIILCLLKANRTQGIHKSLLLVVAGIFCGLLPGIRVTSLLFAIATLVYAVFAYRKTALFLVLGLPSALLSIGWNVYYFGLANFAGGYSSLIQNTGSGYRLTLQYFTEAFSGLLISPSDGLFIFSPVMLFAMPGAYQLFKRRAGRDEKLLLCLAIAALGIFIQYCFFYPWTGGSGSYGPRYMSDTLVVLGFLVCYFIANQIEVVQHKQKRLLTGVFVAFLLSVLLSTLIQTIGAFTTTAWGTIPLPLYNAPGRLWSWNDSQIERSVRSIYYRLVQPIEDGDDYIENVSGTIEQIANKHGQPIITPIVTAPGRQIILNATLQNTGKEQWFGYQTGMIKGETRVRGRFFDSAGQPVLTGSANLLYVSEMPPPQSTAQAIGFVVAPRKPGDYRLVFDLIVQAVGEFPGNATQPPYTVQLTVRKQGE